MKTKAAVLVETGKPLELVELEIPKLKPGQALVKIDVSGVCHTQLLEARGHRGEDKYLPHCLGHEGVGEVIETGDELGTVRAGERVIISWIQGAGRNVPGTTYDWSGRTVNSGAVTTFSDYSVVSENRLTPLGDQSIKSETAAFLGCAIPTGVGSVVNTLNARAGQSLVVIGAGGVGLCAIAGASASGCSPVVAVDRVPLKLEVARKMGADVCIDASREDFVSAVRTRFPKGVDLVVEATGNPEVMEKLFSLLKNQGGQAVVVGNAHHGSLLKIDPFQLNLGKRLLGTWGGDNDPPTHYPRYVNMLETGRLSVDPIVSESYALTDINRALDDLEAGKTVRPLVKMGR